MHVAREHSTSLSQVRCHDIRVVAPHTSASTLPSRKTHLQLIASQYHTGAYETEVNAFAPMDAAGTITNTAVVSGGGITPITVTETIGTESTPILTITKSVSPVPVTENGTLTYTFLIQNAGSAPADIGTDAVIVDTFNPLLSNLAVSFNGTAWAETTNYTYDETTGVFTTIAGQITVPAATYTQNPATGVWTADPGVSTLVVKGTI